MEEKEKKEPGREEAMARVKVPHKSKNKQENRITAGSGTWMQRLEGNYENTTYKKGSEKSRDEDRTKRGGGRRGHTQASVKKQTKERRRNRGGRNKKARRPGRRRANRKPKCTKT